MKIEPYLVLLSWLSMFVRLNALQLRPFGTIFNRWASRPFSSASTGNVSHWDLKTLRIEVTKQCGKTFKKIAKAGEMEDKRRLENIDCSDLSGLRERLTTLTDIDAKLKAITKSDDTQFKSILATLLDMGIDKHPPPQPVKVKKAKVSTAGPRRPYNVFTSDDDIEIWVGKRAADNDLLSCDPQYRHNDEWWLHAAGCAGSHVVIKSTDNELPTKYRDTLFDAAVLAAHHSKAATVGCPSVTLTRCRNVSKPKGFVDGMVQLQGEAIRIEVNMKYERSRLDRLLKQRNI